MKVKLYGNENYMQHLHTVFRMLVAVWRLDWKSVSQWWGCHLGGVIVVWDTEQWQDFHSILKGENRKDPMADWKVQGLSQAKLVPVRFLLSQG